MRGLRLARRNRYAAGRNAEVSFVLAAQQRADPGSDDPVYFSSFPFVALPVHRTGFFILGSPLEESSQDRRLASHQQAVSANTAWGSGSIVQLLMVRKAR